jgi:hypothetical protein
MFDVDLTLNFDAPMGMERLCETSSGIRCNLKHGHVEVEVVFLHLTFVAAP